METTLAKLTTLPNQIEIRAADPASPDLCPLILGNQRHGAATAPAASDHTFGIEDLCQPDIQFFAAYHAGAPLGCGALKALPDGRAEVKSVFVSQSARGQGLARQLMQHLAQIAQHSGFSALVLETGSPLCPGYDAARALYEGLGYDYCPPFGSYVEDPQSVFMRLPLPTSDSAAH